MGQSVELPMPTEFITETTESSKAEGIERYKDIFFFPFVWYTMEQWSIIWSNGQEMAHKLFSRLKIN